MLFYVELHISAVVLEKAFLWKSILKYVGVQNWKATHLPTLDIRVEQKGSLVMKDNKKVKKMKKN